MKYKLRNQIKNCYLKLFGSSRLRVSSLYCASMKGNIGYCIRSLTDRPANLLTSMR